jgi:hypothetical protein
MRALTIGKIAAACLIRSIVCPAASSSAAPSLVILDPEENVFRGVSFQFLPTVPRPDRTLARFV